MKKLIPLICFVYSLNIHAQTFFADLNPGFNGSHPRKFVECNGKMFFFATEPGTNLFELWKSDGTPAGTSMVKNINPSGGSIDYDSPLLVNGSFVYFLADDGVYGKQVWRSDGTSGGTIRLSNSEGFTEPENLTVCGNLVYFSSFDLSYGRELWKTNGSPAGTARAVDSQMGTASGIPDNNTGYPAMADVNGTLYFVATNGFSGYEIYKTDGTQAGTSLVKDLLNGNNTSSKPMNLFSFNGQLLFVFTDGNTGMEPFITDGTSAGTSLLKDINPGADQFSPSGSYPECFTISMGKLFFVANDGTHGLEIWMTDGTSSGTQLVKDVAPGSNGITMFGNELVDAGTAVYFSADYFSTGNIWRTDGTEAGTKAVLTDLSVFTIGGYSIYHHAGIVYMSAVPHSDVSGQRKIYLNQVSTNATWRLPNQDGNLTYVDPGPYFAFDGSIFFGAEDAENGAELWSLDPNQIGTGISEKSSMSLQLFPNPVSDKLKLSYSGATMHYSLISSDGILVKSGFLSSSSSIEMIDLKQGLYLLELKDGEKIYRTKVIKN